MRASIAGVRRGLPPASRRMLDAAAAEAGERGVTLWLVGGAVRDCAAGLPLRDADVALDGDAGALADAVAARTGGEATRFGRFGTAAVHLDGLTLDVAALRRERYRRAGALPAVETGATLEEDLRRRDFSVNAVALALTGPRRGEIADPLGGLGDLAARRLRVLHDRAFADDATRLWRAARYAARLRLRPEPATARLIAGGARWLATISATRLWAEFARTAAERRTLTTLRLLDGWGVLHAVSPALALTDGARDALRRRPGPHDPSLLLAVLLARSRRRSEALDRLAPPRAARRAVEEAARLLAVRSAAPRTLATLEGTGEAARRAALWLDPSRQHTLQRALRRWERTRSPLDAGDLARLGVPPGPATGRALERLRRARYLGTLRTAAEARRALRGISADRARRPRRAGRGGASRRGGAP